MAKDQTQRRSQFVGSDGNEIRFHAVQALELLVGQADILHETGIFNRHGGLDGECL